MTRSIEDLRHCAERCTTHHYACDCRELKFAELKLKCKKFMQILVDEWTFRNSTTGLNNEDSPELKEAKELLEELIK